MATRTPMSGAVLCGGRSSRMGSDKSSLRVAGSTLLERSIALLRTVADPVLVASGDTLLEGRECVLDEVAGRGPLGGIVAALAASPHQLCAVIAVDMPDADPGLLRALARLRRDHDDAVVPAGKFGLEPLHAVYARDALPALRSALGSGDVSVRSALGKLRTRIVDAAALGADPDFAGNLNTAADLSAWMARRRGGVE